MHGVVVEKYNVFCARISLRTQILTRRPVMPKIPFADPVLGQHRIGAYNFETSSFLYLTLLFLVGRDPQPPFMGVPIISRFLGLQHLSTFRLPPLDPWLHPGLLCYLLR